MVFKNLFTVDDFDFEKRDELGKNQITQHTLTGNITCIKLTSHNPRQYARLGNVTLTFFEGFEI